MRLTTRTIILVAIPVIAEIVSVSTLYMLFEHVRAERVKAAHSAALVAKMNALQILSTERSVALITQSSVGGDPSRKIPSHIEDVSRGILYEIDALVKGHEDEERHWKVIRTLSNRVNESLTQAGILYKLGETVQAKIVMVRAERDFVETFKHINEMCAQQQDSQNEMLAREDQTFAAIEAALLVSVLVSIFLAFGLLVYFNRTTSDRLNRLIANAVAMGRGQKPRYAVSGDDELGQLHGSYSRMYEDLTRIREKEKDILEHAAEGITSIDKSQMIDGGNPAFSVMLIGTEEDLSGSLISEHLDKNVCADIASGLERAARDGHTKFVVPLSHRDGKVVTLEWSATWSEAAQRYNCVVLDITERAELERLKAEFVSMVSHDLRSPLNAIQLAFEFLEAEEMSDEGARTVRESSETAARLLSLVNNLLDLDKLDSAGYVLNAKVAPLKPVLQEAINSSRMLAEQSGIQCILQIESELTAKFDAERIMQVMFNLLSNAFKFSDGPGQVTVSARKVGNAVLVQVDDEGSGIPEEMLEAVFERFRQVETSPTAGRRKNGCGLGLAICKAIVEGHGGRIRAEGCKPRGTSIRFTLPLA